MKLLVTGAWKCTDAELDAIRALGHDVIFMQHESDALPCNYADVEGVICNALFLHHDINKFESLKYVQLTSAGLDRVPVMELKRRGIKLFSARGVYSIPMAEFAIAGILGIYKDFPRLRENQKRAAWEKSRTLLELSGKTALIVGCGSVGTECAKRLMAFGCRTIGVDITPYECEYYSEILPLGELDAALRLADIVILTLPLNENTRGIFSCERFEKMKHGAVLVNIARGAIVDEKALAWALKTKLRGALIDVFEAEPLDKSSELWNIENLILTPHNSFVGDGNGKRLFELIKKNMEDFV